MEIKCETCGNWIDQCGHYGGYGCIHCFHDKLKVKERILMDKKCDNCYWEGFKDMFCAYEKNKPNESICNKHSFECECGSIAEYEFEGKYYCSDCLLKEFEVQESTTTHYYLNGEHIGSDDDLSEVIYKLDENIKDLV